MYLSPVALGAVIQRSTVQKGGKRRRLNSPTAPSTPPYLRLPNLPNPPKFDAMESDLSPDDAAKCITGVLHLSSKRSMQHYHYWVMDKSILQKVTDRFRFHKVTNSGGFDFLTSSLLSRIRVKTTTINTIPIMHPFNVNVSTPSKRC
jgi:hypothetical protein